MNFPVLDFTDFLLENDFQTIMEFLPYKEEMKQGVVYHQQLKSSVINLEVRDCKKKQELNKDVLLKIRKIILKPIIRLLKRYKNFRYVWMRLYQTDWLLYEQHNFFSKHQDFEKYICNQIVPYVGILGFIDTIEGGETWIQPNHTCHGSAKRNGFVFFPSNLLHEGKKIIKGQKKCLKMEFFVYFEDTESVQVTCEDDSFKSFWSKKDLELVDNYIYSHSKFKSKNTLQVSAEFSKTIQKIMLDIADPSVCKKYDDFEMVFPNHTPSSLYEIFGLSNFMNQSNGTSSIFMGKDSLAWKFMNTEMKIPDKYRFGVVLWYKKNDRLNYTYSHILDRRGERIDLYKTTVNESTEFVDLNELKANLLNLFFEDKKEIYSPKKNILLEKKNGSIFGTWQNTRLLRDIYKIQPSDIYQKPFHRSGTITETIREWCNDEYSGYDTYDIETYVSYDIQIRYIVHNIE